MVELFDADRRRHHLEKMFTPRALSRCVHSTSSSQAHAHTLHEFEVPGRKQNATAEVERVPLEERLAFFEAELSALKETCRGLSTELKKEREAHAATIQQRDGQTFANDDVMLHLKAVFADDFRRLRKEIETSELKVVDNVMPKVVELVDLVKKDVNEAETRWRQAEKMVWEVATRLRHDDDVGCLGTTASSGAMSWTYARYHDKEFDGNAASSNEEKPGTRVQVCQVP